MTLKDWPMTLKDWIATVSDEIGLDGPLAADDIHTVLDLARDAAHQVQRPAAPLTAYMVGLAVGRGEPLGAVAARVTALAMSQDVTGQGEASDDPDQS